MGILNYFIWNASPDIYTIGSSFALRWYGLFFALGFLVSQQILYYIYKKEGKPEKDVDTLTIYMVVATIIGARLGHVIFYQPELIWEQPWSIILPFEFEPEFTFTGLQGLASHGAAIGILFALWLYSRKRLPGQSYFQILDRIVILVALTGALIRLGNYFNSEIIGKPTDKPWGVVFAHKLSQNIDHNIDSPKGVVESYVYQKNDTAVVDETGRKYVTVYVFFKPNVTLQQANNYCQDLTATASGLYPYFDNYPAPLVDDSEANYFIPTPNKGEQLMAKVNVIGVSRHPAQLYESISCILLFLVLFWIWNRKKENLVPGTIFGIFLVWLWTMRFLMEFLKENQADFESELPINMGQILSIPLIIIGIVIVVRVLMKKPSEGSAS
jgi:prolipoprotein diacylglyceryl transferase